MKIRSLRQSRSAVVCLALFVTALVGEPLSAERSSSAAEPSAREIVETAFDRMFNYPSVRHIKMRVRRNGKLVSYRAFDIAYCRVEGRGRSLLRFTAPDYLRGDGLLIIENDNGVSDAWLHLKGSGKARRVGTYQKRDSFYGTDVTFEDLEHIDWDRAEVTLLPSDEERGRSFFRIQVAPPKDSQYSKMVVRVEAERLAIARIDFYAPGATAIIKSLTIPLDEVTETESVLLPKRMIMTHEGRDSSTEVEFARLEPIETIPPSVLTVDHLQRSTDGLFEVIGRASD